MDEARIEIQAPADAVYDLVADVTRMGEWSPETYRVEWLDGATEAVPGARFRGRNHLARLHLVRWSTVAVVRQAKRGDVLSFDVPTSGARWTYRFRPVADGSACEVVESRELVARPPLTRLLEAVVGERRRRELVAGMEQTLERLKAAAEA